jgi:hypothetical protein
MHIVPDTPMIENHSKIIEAQVKILVEEICK